MVAHEAGSIRHCAGAGQARPRHPAPRWLTAAEVASTRMLILAGGLAAEGLSLRSAVQSAVVQVLSDDRGHRPALGELVDAVLPGTRPNRPARLEPVSTAGHLRRGKAGRYRGGATGEAASTNGQVVFVSAGGSVAEQRREVLVQSALLGAGSLDPRLVQSVCGRVPR